MRIGKAIDFWFDAETEEIAREQMDLLADRMLSNTVIEDWSYELEETEETGIGNISNDNAGTSKHALFDVLRKHGGRGSMRWVVSLMRRPRGMTILLSLYDLFCFLLISSLIVLSLQG